MPPQLRSRSSPPGGHCEEIIMQTSSSSSSSSSTHRHHHRYTPDIAPSSSFDECENIILSSESLHGALHPPHHPSSPSKTLDRLRGGGGRSISFVPKMKRRIRALVAGGGRMLAARKVRLSTIFVAGTMFAVGTIHRLHILALHSAPPPPAAGKDDGGDGGVRGVAAHHDRHHRGWRGNDNAPQTPTSRGSSSSSSSMRRLRKHPRVVNVAHIVMQESTANDDPSKARSIFDGKRIYNNLMLRREEGTMGSSQVVSSNLDGVVNDEVVDGGVDDGETTAEGGGGEARTCVPMADWQTTSYPNCNTVHEIDMVRSSGIGSLTFPRYKREGGRRRRVTTHPRILHEYLDDLHMNYPTRNRKRNAKANAMGLMREETVEFLGQGWFRSAWEMYVEQIPGYDEEEEEWGFEESVVLKTLRIERDFLPEYYELHRRDALAMERLTFSPYVLDIYGYCGQSAINELADFGIEGMSSLEKIARSFRGMEDIEPVSKIKLQLASMIAAGVSHVHSIDHPDFPYPVENDSDDDPSKDYVGERKKRTLLGDIDGGRAKVSSNATLVHYDLNPRNIAVVRRGKPKLNDFNVAEFMTWDVENNRTCGFSGRFREPWWRAPEEMHFHMPNNDTDHHRHHIPPAPLTEKIDIYSLGNILMEILTSHSPWGLMQKGQAEEETRPKVARGELPDFPDDFNVTKLTSDPALMAIDRAMRKCLRFLPEDRPTAGEIAAELFEAIDNLPEGFGNKEKWRREREMEDRRMMEDKREAEEANYDERIGATTSSEVDDEVAVERKGLALVEGRTRHDDVAVEREGRVHEGRTRRDRIVVENDRTSARGKKSFDGI